MSTEVTWQTNSTSSEQTEQLGVKLGASLKGGEVIELVSDLGGGKTTFVRGLARGAQTTDKVASPSFTISKIYVCPRFQIHHFDFYRLSEPGVVTHELAEIIGDPQVVVVIEWADVVQHILPNERLTIRIRQTENEAREITFHCPQSLAYLIKGLE